MFASILGMATKVLSGVWGYVAAFGVGAAIAGFIAWRVCSWDYGAQIATMKLNDANFAKNAIQQSADAQARQDKVALNSAVSEAYAQGKLQAQTVTITKEIPVHVPDIRACIPVGLIRVLNGAATGSDPGSLGIAPGQSDDACAQISWRAFAADLVDDYGLGNQNAEQLDALIVFERNREATEVSK